VDFQPHIDAKREAEQALQDELDKIEAVKEQIAVARTELDEMLDVADSFKVEQQHGLVFTLEHERKIREARLPRLRLAIENAQSTLNATATGERAKALRDQIDVTDKLAHRIDALAFELERAMLDFEAAKQRRHELARSISFAAGYAGRSAWSDVRQWAGEALGFQTGNIAASGISFVDYDEQYVGDLRSAVGGAKR
jgi:hypothetical protein